MNDQDKLSSPKIKFNLLDGVILLLIVLCIVGVCFRYTIMDQLGFGTELEKYKVSFTVSAADSRLPDFLAAGNRLYFQDGVKAGLLLSVTEFAGITRSDAGSEVLVISPASAYADNGKGEIVQVSYPDGTKIDARGAFVCEGAYSEDNYFSVSGEKLLTIGQKLTLYTDTVTLNITVTGISPYAG